MLYIVLASLVGGMILRRVVDVARPVTVLNWWVITIGVPALTLHKIPRLEFGADVTVPVVVAWCALAAGASAVLVASRVGGWSSARTGTLLLMVPLGNTSFLGLPAVEVLLGADHVGSAIAFDQGGSFLALVTFGSLVATRYGSDRDAPVADRVVPVADRDASAAGTSQIGPILRKIVRFPPFLALLGAIALRRFDAPGPVDDLLGRLGATVGPAAMCSLGMRVTLTGLAQHRRLVAGVLGWRLVLLPAVVLVVAVALGDPSAVGWRVAVLQAGMPTMVTAGVLAGDSGLDGDVAALVVGAGTAVALASLPAWAGVLELVG